jgi:hypothetical protein
MYNVDDLQCSDVRDVMLQQLHASQHVAATARILAREVELEGT